MPGKKSATKKSATRKSATKESAIKKPITHEEHEALKALIDKTTQQWLVKQCISVLGYDNAKANTIPSSKHSESQLMTVPAEIRIQILTLALVQNYNISTNPNTFRTKQVNGVLRANRQLRNEGLQVFYGKNRFTFDLAFNWERGRICRYLEMSGPSVEYIRKVDFKFAPRSQNKGVLRLELRGTKVVKCHWEGDPDVAKAAKKLGFCIEKMMLSGKLGVKGWLEVYDSVVRNVVGLRRQLH